VHIPPGSFLLVSLSALACPGHAPLNSRSPIPPTRRRVLTPTSVKTFILIYKTFICKDLNCGCFHCAGLCFLTPQDCNPLQLTSTGHASLAAIRGRKSKKGRMHNTRVHNSFFRFLINAGSNSSAFALHIEDKGLASVNYCHYGAPKVLLSHFVQQLDAVFVPVDMRPQTLGCVHTRRH
jgi:hypothetical protein